MSQGHGLHWWTTRYGGGRATAHPVLVINWGDFVHVEGLTGRWKGRRFSVVRNEITTYVPLGAKLAPGAKVYATGGARGPERDRSGGGSIKAKLFEENAIYQRGHDAPRGSKLYLRAMRAKRRMDAIRRRLRASRDCIGVHTHDARVTARYLKRANRASKARSRSRRR